MASNNPTTTSPQPSPIAIAVRPDAVDNASASASGLVYQDDPADYCELPAMHMLELELGRVVASGPRQGVLPTSPNQRARPDLATLTSADWDIHPVSGFNPPEAPLARLGGAFEAWERMLDEAGSLSLADPRLSVDPNRSWRGRIEGMDVLDAAELDDIRALRRAHVCLAFLSNLYVFSGGPRDSAGVPIVPAPIAVPLLHVSDRLDIPPVVTYADTVLWNWALKDPALGQAAGNFRILTTFSQTRTEERFYEVPCDMEALGAPALRIMAAIRNEAFLGDRLARKRMAAYLLQLATLVGRIADIFPTFLPDCDPTVFYHSSRPWFHGGSRRFVMSADDRSLDTVLDFGGPSAGQATLIHSLDVFLGVEHASESSVFESSFMSRMALYMPSLHRRFLTHLAAQRPTVRELAIADAEAHGADQGELVRAYDVAIVALRRLRDMHTRIVVSHIVTPARKAAKEADKLAAASPAIAASTDGLEGELTDKPLVGTGGSDLVAFLRLTRAKTIEAMLRPT